MHRLYNMNVYPIMRNSKPCFIAMHKDENSIKVVIDTSIVDRRRIKIKIECEH